MPSFDTTDVAAHVVPPGQENKPIDPIGMLGKFAQIQNEVNQNKLFQAKTLAGNYMSQSVGPDGKPDLNKFAQLMQADQRTAIAGPEAFQDAQTLQNSNTTGRQLGLDLNTKSQANALQAASIFGNTSKNPDTSPGGGRDQENLKAITYGLGQGVATGAILPDTAASLLGNPDKLLQISRAATIGGAGGQGAYDTLVGKPAEIQTGGHLKAVNVNAATNTITSMGGNAAVIPDEETPEFRAGRVGIVGPNNTPEQAPQSALSTPTGEAKVVPGLTGPHGETQSGLAPGVGETQAGVAKNAADQYTDLRTAYADSANRKTLINNVLTAAKNTRTGPNAPIAANVVTEANRILGTHFDEKSTTATQMVEALGNQLVSQEDNLIGRSSGKASLLVGHGANPSGIINNDTIAQLGAQMLGNEDQIQAKAKAAEGWLNQKNPDGSKKNNVTKFNDFQNEWIGNVDPRVFQEPYMSTEQTKELQANLTSSGRLGEYNTKKARVLKLLQQPWMK